MPTGITVETIKNIQFDAGAAYLNYGAGGQKLLGATRGGSTFKVEREYREPEVDSVKGSLKGAKRLIRETATLTVRLIEITTANIQAALPGTAATDYPATEGKTHDKIVSNGAIAFTDYLTNVALVADISGSTDPLICIVNTALADGGLELSTQDKGEGVIEVTFKSHIDPANINNSPWEIRNPVRA